MHHLAQPQSFKLPRTIYYLNIPDPTREIIADAIVAWNTIYPCFTTVLTPDADVTFQFAERTWVKMPSTTDPKSVVYLGQDVSLTYWLEHELGHTLGLADHIRDGSSPTGYINPALCPSNPYAGVMSYCSSRENWLTREDQLMLKRLFPLRRRNVIPGISR